MLEDNSIHFRRSDMWNCVQPELLLRAQRLGEDSWTLSGYSSMIADTVSSVVHMELNRLQVA